MRSAIGVIRHTNHDRVGLPLLELGGHAVEPGVALGMDGALGLRSLQQTIANSDSRALEPKIKGNECRQVGRHRHSRCVHACPAWVEIIQACRPSKASALS